MSRRLLRTARGPNARARTSRKSSARTTRLTSPSTAISFARPDGSLVKTVRLRSRRPTCVRESALSAWRTASADASYRHATCASLAGPSSSSSRKTGGLGPPQTSAAVLVRPPQSAWNSASAGAPSYQRTGPWCVEPPLPPLQPIGTSAVCRARRVGSESSSTVETFARVPSDVRQGVGPADDRLHLEHGFDDCLVASRGCELAEHRGLDVVFERNVTVVCFACSRTSDANRGGGAIGRAHVEPLGARAGAAQRHHGGSDQQRRDRPFHVRSIGPGWQ